MTPERFCALLDAHGADFRRWPEAERASARALAALDSSELRLRLAEAALLDGWLDSHVVAVADEALIRRIVADAADAAGVTNEANTAGVANAAAMANATVVTNAADASNAAGVAADMATTRPGLAAARTPWWKARWWWRGAGLAGIGLAGTLAGAFVVSAALRFAAPPGATDWPERATAFSELPADWSEE